MILLKLFLTVLIADFITGIGHWIEDTYASKDWPYLQQSIVLPNIEHHTNPRAFVKRDYWSRNSTLVKAGVVVMFVLFSFNVTNPYIYFMVFLLSQTNEIHAYAHRTKSEAGWLVSKLQKIGLMQDRQHHLHHHSSPYDIKYCILTNYLNPILDKINFWKRLEQLLQSRFEIVPVRNTVKRDFK